MRCIVPDTQGAGTRLLLLSEAVKDPGPPFHWSSQHEKTDESTMGVALTRLTERLMCADLAGLREDLQQLVHEEGLEVSDYDQELGYDYWPADHVLRVSWLQPLTCVMSQILSSFG